MSSPSRFRDDIGRSSDGSFIRRLQPAIRRMKTFSECPVLYRITSFVWRRGIGSNPVVVRFSNEFEPIGLKRQSLIQRGEQSPHGLSLAAFRPTGSGLIVPRVHINVRPGDIGGDEAPQEQSGDDRTGKRF